MVCSLADREHDFEPPPNLKYKTPSKVVLESDDDEEPPAYNPKKYVFPFILYLHREYQNLFNC